MIAAIAVGAGNLGGAHEVFHAIEYWQQCQNSLETWEQLIKQPPSRGREDVWLPMEHTPGFDPNGVSCPTPVKQTLAYLADVGKGINLQWLANNRTTLETFAGCPLAFSGVAAAALYDLEFLPEQAEMLFLLLRLPGAAIHSLEQERLGWRKYPFFANGFKLNP
jgi:citrate synthase